MGKFFKLKNNRNLQQHQGEFRQNQLEIITLLDHLSKDFELIQKEFNSIIRVRDRHEKESSLQTYTQEIQSFEKAVVSKVQNNRTHPKIKLMENIFGKKEYITNQPMTGNSPKSSSSKGISRLKYFLKTCKDKMSLMVIFIITQGNQISLNLKVYTNNGAQIVSDSPENCFMQGLCQTQIKNGVGIFSKIHPRQISRAFSGKGICIIIYATSQQNQANEQGLRIQASEIQSLIFYNIKVVVEQNKFLLKNQKQTALDLDDQN